MNRAGAPIIFIHYGPEDYLKWTLDCAVRSNRGKRVIFLGDESNRKFAKGRVEFFSFAEFSAGEKVAKFEQVFRPVQGERHRFKKHGGVDLWLKFVFLRWFLIEEFLRSEGIDAFWTFDSDTLILAELKSREGRFSKVEASTQCRGRCLNGWVGSRDLVERYTSCMLDLFSDADYLERQRERLKVQSGLSFNEMDAFSEFCERYGVKTVRASEVADGEAFDDALGFSEDYEVSPREIVKRLEVKRLWTSDHGGVFARLRDSGEMVRLLTCNMSWMPEYLYRTLYRFRESRAMSVGRAEEYYEIPLQQGRMDRVWSVGRQAVGKFLPRTS